MAVFRCDIYIKFGPVFYKVFQVMDAEGILYVIISCSGHKAYIIYCESIIPDTNIELSH